MQARRAGEGSLVTLLSVLVAFAFVQILLGALVAGIDGGRGFPNWPLMVTGAGASFLPPDPFTITPLWRNFFEDVGLVQFIHRTSAYLLFGFGVFVWWRGRASANSLTRFSINAVLAVMTLQMVIGIVTVLYNADVKFAITHQFTAVVLWVLILRARYLARYPIAQSIRGT